MLNKHQISLTCITKNKIYYTKDISVINKPKTIYTFTKKLKMLCIKKKDKIEMIQLFNRNLNILILNTITKNQNNKDTEKIIDAMCRIDNDIYKDLLLGKKHVNFKHINMDSLHKTKYKTEIELTQIERKKKGIDV